MAQQPEVSFSSQDLFDFPDPYPLFASLRASSPVLRVEQFRRETFMVTRYDDVATVLPHYAGGAAYGPTFTQTIGPLGGDLGFRTYVDTASIPEPVTMLLFGFGLLGLAGVRRKFKK